MIKYLIFDFDGVIVDSEILAAKAFNKILNEININEYSPELIASKYAGNKTIKVASELAKIHNIPDYNIIYNKVMRTVGSLYDKDLKEVERIRSFLEINDLELFIGSNSGKQRIIKGLLKVGLSKYFNEKNIYSFEMVKNPKPSPDIYLKIIEDNKLNSKEVIVLEDSVLGVKSAIDANLKVIGVTAASHWTNRSPQILIDAGSYQTINTYLDLIKILKKL